MKTLRLGLLVSFFLSTQIHLGFSETATQNLCSVAFEDGVPATPDFLSNENIQNLDDFHPEAISYENFEKIVTLLKENHLYYFTPHLFLDQVAARINYLRGGRRQELLITIEVIVKSKSNGEHRRVLLDLYSRTKPVHSELENAVSKVIESVLGDTASHYYRIAGKGFFEFTKAQQSWEIKYRKRYTSPYRPSIEDISVNPTDPNFFTYLMKTPSIENVEKKRLKAPSTTGVNKENP